MAEVLAPVGNNEMLIAAVRSGADAVYLGAKEFSARRNAENFSLEELKNAIDYCHIRGVKVYLTLNILLKEKELKSAFYLARDVHNLGIDGIIIEDLGLARILREKIPDLKLHASTQMTVHSPSALPLLKELGFCQAVISREMSKDEIALFCQRAKEYGITVEVFVHGALCMSMSGQCLLSAFLGSRSGNRGLCAGPCRLPFSVKGGTGYDLSLKDLSLLNHLNELKELGVGSFKIEGRMKRPEYVAAAVAACRQALDRGKTEQKLEETLRNVFSRQGFTDGYYKNNLGREMFGIRTKEDVLSADKAFPFLHELYRGERQSVPITLNAEIRADKPIELTLSDGENRVCVKGEIPSRAKTKSAREEDVIKNLTKFGATPYFVSKTRVELDDGLFVSGGSLNSLRREATALLDGRRKENNTEKSNAEYLGNDYKVGEKQKQRLFARFEDSSQIPDNLDSLDGILFPIEKEPLFELDPNTEYIVDIPKAISSEKAVLERLKKFKEKGFKKALCENLAVMEIAGQEGFEILAGSGLNLANSEALETVRRMGAEAALLSPEEQISDLKRLKSPIKRGIYAYGNIPLMIFKNCPLRNGISCGDCKKNGVITDRMGIEFPVRCRLGYSELLNSLPIWLADRLDEVSDFDFLVLYFSREDKNTAGRVIDAYKKGSPPMFNHTRGLYYRGTI